MKTKKRSRSVSNDQLRKAMAGLPRLRHFGESNAPTELVASFNRSYRSLAVTRKGLTKAEWKAITNINDTTEFRARAFVRLPDAIYAGMDSRLVANHCPPCGSQCLLGRHKTLDVYWNRITSTDIGTKTFYHWPDRPTVRINGGEYVAGFRVHSILRMLERLNLDFSRGRMSLARVMRCSDIEVDGKGFWIWMSIGDQSIGADIARILTGTEMPGSYKLRAAYCPVEYHGRFAVASTAMHPAMMVDGINSALLTYKNLGDRVERAWHELCRLHDQLPTVRWAGNVGDKFSLELARLHVKL